jgi:hypothetical protein
VIQAKEYKDMLRRNPQAVQLAVPRCRPNRRLVSRFLALALTCFAIGAEAEAEAATLGFFDFDSASGEFTTVADTLAAHVGSTVLSDSDGTLTSVTGVSGFAASARDWDDGNAFLFTLTADPGYHMVVDGYSFSERASATGPTSWRLLLNGLEVAIGSTHPAFTAMSGVLPEFGPASTVQVFLTADGAVSTSGTWRIDNLVLNGTVAPVPLPPALPLLVLGVASLLVSAGTRGHRKAGAAVA